MWTPGDLLTHRDNPGLGIGRVVSVERRALVAHFPRTGATLRVALSSNALAPLDIRPGRRVRVVATGREAVVQAVLPDGRLRLDDGGAAGTGDVWPLSLEGELVERLAAGELDRPEDVALRLDALDLARLREAEGLGSFLGGRIRLFPHQLYTAERATVADPVRWLLSDEVGLGKTVEACLILNRLVRTGRVERVLVVAPSTLTVQWLGELWRKHHQVFVLMDDTRLADVARDFGRDFNPFDVHRQVVVALETLVAQPRLTEQAVAAGIDLLVVDEAHRMRRPRDHRGDAAWRVVAPIAALGRHVLLLTAIPFEDDAHGFLRMLQLLRPDQFPDDDFDARLARAEPLPPCTSATRRVDVGGLPPRAPRPVAIAEQDWQPRAALEAATRSAPAPHAVARRAKADRVRRAISSGAALVPVLAPDERALRTLAGEADVADPRTAWLAAQAPLWKAAGEKTLVFVADRATLELLRASLSRLAQLATAAFHEDLSPGRRDIEVAQFRRPEGPSLLVSTECGGEGRNFEFCHRLVLFDLPWSAVVVEQRIGRLDRIGRRWPVEIVYFRPPAGIGADVARLYEAIGLFLEPLASLEPELAGVEQALEDAATDPAGTLSVAQFHALVQETDAARLRVRQAAYRERHRDPYRPEMAASILARVPADLDALNERVVVGACERLGLHVEALSSRRTFSVEMGGEAMVDSLPGMADAFSFLGTFDRELAVEDESLDFFAAGHPLVEGVLAHLEEAPFGRVAAVGASIGGEGELALLALYRQGGEVEAVCVGPDGHRRPDWAAVLTRRPLPWTPVPEDAIRDPDWPAAVRRLAALLDPGRRPVALVGVRLGPGP